MFGVVVGEEWVELLIGQELNGIIDQKEEDGNYYFTNSVDRNSSVE